MQANSESSSNYEHELEVFIRAIGLTEDDADSQGSERLEFAITPWKTIRGRSPRYPPSR